ncbi:MAG: DsrE family protein [Promethearchaeota archaeon]
MHVMKLNPHAPHHQAEAVVLSCLLLVKLIIEGTATQQIKELADPKQSFVNLYEKIKQLGLIDCVCKACSNKMESLTSAEEQELSLCDEMSGHPSMAKYIDEGYDVITL